MIEVRNVHFRYQHGEEGAGLSGVDLHAAAGKTGTAQTDEQDNDHAWFAGYVPADRPRVAFVVVLEHAGNAGETGSEQCRQQHGGGQ